MWRAHHAGTVGVVAGSKPRVVLHEEMGFALAAKAVRVWLSPATRGTAVRRTLASVVVSAMVLAVMAVPLPAGGVAGFGDIDANKFFTEPVQWMVDNSITGGTSPTCFSPGDPVTRGQAAAFMWRMEGSPTGSPPHPFTDVFAAWQQVPMSWMVDNDITTGTTTTTYSPDNPVTRGRCGRPVASSGRLTVRSTANPVH